MVPGTEGYADAAASLLRTRLAFAEVHAPILRFIPKAPASILDIGSGPGHDAAHLAGAGHAVVAAEPTPDLRAGAIALYGDKSIRWIDDSLPELQAVSALGERFDFVLSSGVWMHLSESERRAAMPNVAALLAPGGAFALSLRYGPVPAGRRMFAVSAEETIALAGRAGLEPILDVARDSLQPGNRAAGVTWRILAFMNPRRVTPAAAPR